MRQLKCAMKFLYVVVKVKLSLELPVSERIYCKSVKLQTTAQIISRPTEMLHITRE